MATQTYHEYSGDDNDLTFDYSFPTYLVTEVKVQVDGVDVDNYTVPNYTTTGTHTVTFDSTTGTRNNTLCTATGAPRTGLSVRVYRDTNVDAAKRTYQVGSAVKAEDLNTNQEQILRALQEEQYNLGTGKLQTTDYRDNSITGAKIKAESIDSDHYVDGSIDAIHLSDNSVDSRHYVDGSIDNDHLSANSIAEANLQNDCITGAKIRDSQIESEHYATGSIDAAHLSTNSVTSNAIIANAVGTDEIATNAVTANELANNSVDTNAILDLNVTRTKIENDAIDGSKLADNACNSEHYTDASIDAVHLAVSGTASSANFLRGDYTWAVPSVAAGSVTGDSIANDEIDSQHYKEDSIDSEHYAPGSVDTTAIADDAVNADKIADAVIVTNSEQASHTANDTTFYTTAASDARYYNIGTTEEIVSGETWVGDDTKIATTKAIDNRIVDLVDDVGGFVALDSEAAIPTNHPEAANATASDRVGTIISIKALSATYTPSGGTCTIPSGTLTNHSNAATITGCGSTTLSSGYGVLIETTAQTDAQYTAGPSFKFHRLVPKATEVTTLAGKATEMGRLGTADAVADMNTLGTTAIVSDMDTLADISSNISTVAGIHANVTSVANNETNINAVAADAIDIGAVAGKATEIGRLGTADAVADMNTLGTTAIVADMDALADIAGNITKVADIDANVTKVADIDGNVTKVADIDDKVTTVAGIDVKVTTVANNNSNVTAVADNATNINTVAGVDGHVTTVAGVSGHVTTVAGISSEVTTVAGDATDIGTVAGKSTEIGRLGTAAAVADMALLGTTACVADMALLATTACIADMALLGDSAVIADMATIADTSGLIADIDTVAGIQSDVTAVAGKATEIGRLGTTAAVADMALLGTTACVADMALLGTTACVADMALLGTTACIADMATIADTSGLIADIGTVAGNNANVSTVAGSIGSVNTVAGSIADVNRYANEYKIGSEPGSPTEGDLWYDGTNNVLKYRDDSGWEAISSGGIASVSADTSPQLGGHLDANNKNITSAGSIAATSLDISGDVDVDGTLETDALTINGTASLPFESADHSKLDGIEANATADQTAAEIRTLVGNATDSNVFTDADHSKLDGIATSANNYTHPTSAGNKHIPSGGSSGQFLKYDSSGTAVWASDNNTTYTAGTGLSLSGTEFSVTAVALTTVQTAANQTAHLALTTQEGDVVVRSDENKSYVRNSGTAGTMADFTLLATPTDAVLSVNGNTGAITAAQIASAVEAASDSNTFTDDDHSKLNAIEANATADQTAAEIKTAYESNSDTNAFTDADHSKLDGIASSANNYTHPTSAGNKHIPSGGSSGQYLKYDSSGTAVWADVSTSDSTKMPLAGGTFTGDVVFDNTTHADKDLTWDMSDKALEFKDDVKAYFGDSKDLQIEHTGGNNIISGVSGKTIIKASANFDITTGSNASMIECYNDGEVKLFHNGTYKAKTVSGGFTVDGTCTATAFAGDGSALTGITSAGTGEKYVYYKNSAGNASNSGSNVYAGYLSGEDLANGASYNTFYGNESGKNISTGDYNVFVGHYAGLNQVSNESNVGIGPGAIQDVVGSGNVAVGRSAINEGSTSTANCVAIGNYAGANMEGGTNVAVGSQALMGNSNTTDACEDNVAIGYKSLETIQTGYKNIAIGTEAGYDNTTGSVNVFIGYKAAQDNIDGDSNIVLGFEAGGSIRGDNNIVIGRSANCSGTSAANEITLGNTDITKFRIPGINFTVKDTTATEDYVLTVDANGEAGWEAAGGGTVADECVYENSQTISNNYTMSTNKNGMSAGPITVSATVTIPSGSSWSIV